MVSRIGLGNLAVAEHQTDRTAVGLEDACAEINVRNANEHRQEEEDVMHELGNEHCFGGKVHLARAVG